MVMVPGILLLGEEWLSSEAVQRQTTKIVGRGACAVVASESVHRRPARIGDGCTMNSAKGTEREW